MPEDVQIRFGADIGGALSAIDTLKRAVAGVAEPVARLKTPFTEAGAAAQQSGAAALSAFRSDLQRMVAEHALSLQQALGFDIEYTARRSAEERSRLECDPFRGLLIRAIVLTQPSTPLSARTFLG